MKKFGLFLLVVVLIAILGGSVFLAFWDMPMTTTTETKDITKEIASD
jgi:hypothetical protein